MSAATFGLPQVVGGRVTLRAAGVWPADAVGKPSLQGGRQYLRPTGIVAGGLGTPASSTTTTRLGSVASAEAFGMATLVGGTVRVNPSSVWPAYQVGQPAVQGGVQFIRPLGDIAPQS